jgi:hypothetical protein
MLWRCRDHHCSHRVGAGRDWLAGVEKATFRRYFGEPPNDIWPAARERLHERNDFVRLNRPDVVTLDRTALVLGALASLPGGGVLATAPAVAQTEGTAEVLSEVSFLGALGALRASLPRATALWRLAALRAAGHRTAMAAEATAAAGATAAAAVVAAAVSSALRAM